MKANLKIGILFLAFFAGGVLAQTMNSAAELVADGSPICRILSFLPIVGGVLFSTVLNPSVFIWWATVGFAMLMEAVLVASLIGAVLWLVGHFLADILCFSAVSYMVARGEWSQKGKVQKYLLVTFGCVLLVFGVYFLIKYGVRIWHRPKERPI